MSPLSDFDRRSRHFLDWFQNLPGATFRPDIEIRDLRHRQAGRGIVATADIEADTVLFTIPRRSILNVHNSELPALLPHVFAEPALEDHDADAEDTAQDPWSTLMLVMLHEYLKGAASAWHPYFAVLPQDFDTPMFWADAELRALQASTVVPRIGKADMTRMIETKILAVVRAHPEVFFSAGTPRPDDTVLLEVAHRMGSTIMAYAFDLETDDDDEETAMRGDEDEWIEDKEGRITMGMVPMADILNADAEFNAHINHGEDALTAVALRPIRAGEEILNYYGPLPNGELLRRYGYTTEKHARYDVVELPWDLVAKRMREQLNVNEEQWSTLMQTFDEEDLEDGFVIERQSDDPDSTGMVHDQPVFAGLPEELTEQAKGVLKAARKVFSGLGLDEKSKREEVSLRSTLMALGDRLSQYETTLEQDEELLASNATTGRLRMAIIVRRGEKLLLREAHRWTSERLEQVVAARREEGEPASKRQRTRQ